MERAPSGRTGFSVTVIGAGMGGLNAALMLKRAGIPYTVIEKNSGVGGTWWETRYPGARVDTPSRRYTHIFGARVPLPEPVLRAEENQRYFDWVADTFELREDIVFDTEVRALTWDEAAAEWEIEVDGPGRRADAALERGDHRGRLPQPPAGPRDRGHGRLPRAVVAHVALARGRRRHGQARRGDRHRLHRLPADPGARAEAEHVVAFQRTPQWLFGVPGYLSPFPSEVAWLDRNLPFYTNFMRLRACSGSARRSCA